VVKIRMQMMETTSEKCAQNQRQNEIISLKYYHDDGALGETIKSTIHNVFSLKGKKERACTSEF
jgi:hypothetical protein